MQRWYAIFKTSPDLKMGRAGKKKKKGFEVNIGGQAEGNVPLATKHLEPEGPWFFYSGPQGTLCKCKLVNRHQGRDAPKLRCREKSGIQRNGSAMGKSLKRSGEAIRKIGDKPTKKGELQNRKGGFDTYNY